jgi:ABC-type uncharacterized transport system substrate-binding protein
MQRWWKRFSISFAALGMIALSAQPSVAHPHVFIDMKTEFRLDDKGHLEALRITWIFDEFYSAYAVDGAPKENGAYDEKYLASLAEENLKNLAEWNYFAEVTAGGAPVETGEALDGLSTWNEETGRLSLTFTLPLGVPQAATAGAPVNVRIFDPSYYITIDYVSDDPVSLAGGPHRGCSVAIDVPQVEQVWTSLPESAFTNPDSRLGANFASTATLGCTPEKS